MSFADRFGPKRNLPPRITRDEAPEAVRRCPPRPAGRRRRARRIRVLCSYLDRVPDDPWGNERYDAVAWLIKKLDWWQVYELIEPHSGGLYDAERVEKLFSENGVAFQYVGGEMIPWEPDAEELEVAGIEDLPAQTQDPKGRFVAPKARTAKR